ncbi:MAG: hypothetical protein GTN65_12125, partial [Armatimonadetes bacterium]|nr:hypothetical protein [Armatimonadota bacterium]NIO97814.1 hypothetical protein [Armatimonadota bacterium]
LPLILLGGAALMLMGGKKKKPEPEPEPEPEIEGEEPVVATMLVEEPLAVKCQKFIDAIWVEPQEGEIPIKSVVAEETILPEMTAVAKERREKAGKDLSPDFANTLVMMGLNLVAPNCNFVLTSLGWRYADNQTFEGKLLDVYEGMKALALKVIEDVNKPVAETIGLAPAGEGPPPPKPEEPGPFGLSEG